MKDKQNEFYTSISEYYADIFPYQPMQLQFVKSRVGEMAGKQILDIGCATGELAFQMAKEGAKVTGIDLNEDLLQQTTGRFDSLAAHSKRESEPDSYQVASPNPKFQVGNMLNLESDFRPGQFDAVLCFGNTLVHLHTLDLMLQMLNGVYSVLKPGGQFLMQILNYDYILNERVTELPLIDTENIRFIRNYGLEENNPLIRFQTQLEIKKEDKIVSNETLLFALKSTELLSLLKTSGFKNIELFSNFKQETFGGKHIPLVVSCKKLIS